jgi:hypothetical protein
VSERLKQSLNASEGRVGKWRSPPKQSGGSQRTTRHGTKHVQEPESDSSDADDDLLVGAALLTVDEAMQSNDWDHWQEAMDKEIKTLEDFGTWRLVDLPPGRKTIGCKWHLTRKVNADGSPGEFKARLVAKGYSQIEGVDYFETFAPVARIQSIRITLALANELDLDVDQIDIKAAYLNGWMDEEIYMVQPPGYVNRRARRKACLLIRGLYGTKQAGNIWNKSLNGTMEKNGFKRTRSDQCVYLVGSTRDLSKLVIVIVYVDDILVIGHASALALRRRIIEALKSEYSVKEMGPVSRYLGILVKRNHKDGIMVISQRDFAVQVLERFNMKECLPIETPMMVKADIEPRRNDEEGTNKPYRSLVGSLMYLTMCTRPDLAHAVGVLSRFLENPAERHWDMGIRVLKYLKGTLDQGLEYKRGQKITIQGYSDSDWVSDKATGRSTRGFLVYLGENLMNWKSKRHRSVATSTTCAEVEALYHGVLDSEWIRNFLNELGMRTAVSEWFCDNQAAVAIVNSSKNVDKVRHELVKIHYIREKINNELVTVEYVPTDEMIADMLTKQLPRNQFKECRNELGLAECTRSEKWGSVGNDLSDREQNEANMVSLDSPDREESNGLRFVENGDELMELGAYFVNAQQQNCGTKHVQKLCNDPAVTIMEPEEWRCSRYYSDWFIPGYREGNMWFRTWDREIGLAVKARLEPTDSNEPSAEKSTSVAQEARHA